jgi:hypothetical protein
MWRIEDFAPQMSDFLFGFMAENHSSFLGFPALYRSSGL